MPIAYVLLSGEPGKTTQIVEKVTQIQQVQDACLVNGVYDVVIKIETETTTHLKNIISWNVRRLSCVKSAFTLIVKQ